MGTSEGVMVFFGCEIGSAAILACFSSIFCGLPVMRLTWSSWRKPKLVGWVGLVCTVNFGSNLGEPGSVLSPTISASFFGGGCSAPPDDAGSSCTGL